jgi:hypothetical protein
MKKAFINSLPKSGTHLTAKCLKLLGYEERDHLGSAQVLNPGIVAKLRRLAWAPMRQGFLLGVDTPVEVSRRPIRRMLRSAPEKSFLTAHVGYNTALLGEALHYGFKPIVVTRDPRAVVVSFVHYVATREAHVLHREYKELSIEDRFEAVLRGRRFKSAYLEPMRTRCLAMDGWIHHPEVLKIRFEDLVGEKGGGSEASQRETIERLCAWLEAPESNIPTIVETLFGPGRHTFRKGQVDSWREELDPALLEVLERDMSDVLDRWGYTTQSTPLQV